MAAIRIFTKETLSKHLQMRGYIVPGEKIPDGWLAFFNQHPKQLYDELDIPTTIFSVYPDIVHHRIQDPQIWLEGQLEDNDSPTTYIKAAHWLCHLYDYQLANPSVKMMDASAQLYRMHTIITKAIEIYNASHYPTNEKLGFMDFGLAGDNPLNHLIQHLELINRQIELRNRAEEPTTSFTRRASSPSSTQDTEIAEYSPVDVIAMDLEPSTDKTIHFHSLQRTQSLPLNFTTEKGYFTTLLRTQSDIGTSR